MSFGYGTLHIYDVNGDDDAVRQAVEKIVSAVAELGEFEIDIEMHSITDIEEASA